MKLIRKLTPKRNFKGKLQYLGIFLCSFCLQEVTRQLIHGINQKSCGCQKGKLISEANIGREVWNKGKAGIYSDETLSLMSNKAKTRENKLKGLHRTEEAKQNMSKAQKERFKNKENHPMFGKKQTEKSKKKNSESRKGKCIGEQNPNWCNGVSFEIYPKEFKYVRQSILERDNYHCQFPGCIEIHDRLHVHHIDYNKKNNNPENLITLGTSCHMKTNSKKMKNYWTEFYQNIMINRIMECLL